ncbi:MAG: hypothetical protein NZ822_01825 [Patescibacteria group bacterium]|nr:hypothetical protein [Patescibacteria group bacterium]
MIRKLFRLRLFYIFLLLLLLVFVSLILGTRNSYKSYHLSNEKDIFLNDSRSSLSRVSNSEQNGKNLKPLLPKNNSDSEKDEINTNITQNSEEKNRIEKTPLRYGTKFNPYSASKSKIPVLKCQSLINKDKIIFLKQGGLYGEVSALRSKSYFVFFDDCLWIWADGKRSGLKICSQQLNVPIINVNIDNANEKEINRELKEKKLDLACTKTQLVDDKFRPPSEIDFLLINPDISLPKIFE